MAIGRPVGRPHREAVGSSLGTVFAAAASGSVDCDALKGGRPSSDYTPPLVVSTVSATPAGEPFRVDVVWSIVSDPSAPVAYRVYRNGGLVATTSATTWTDTTIARGATYRYVIRPLDAAGNLGDASVPAKATTPPTAPPPPPLPTAPPPADGGVGGAAPADLGVRLEPRSADLVPGAGRRDPRDGVQRRRHTDLYYCTERADDAFVQDELFTSATAQGNRRLL